MKTIFTWSILFLILFSTSDSIAGDDWTQKNPSSKPSARDKHAMCYISGGRVLLFGGYDGSSYLQDTWVYDVSSNTWTQPSVNTPPGVRSETGMAYIGNDQALLFGGKNSYMKLGDTWLFSYNPSNNTGTWTLKISAESAYHPYHRAGHAMAYAGNDDVILLGGVDYDNGKRQDTWHYDLTTNTWTQKADASTVIQAHAMCYIGGTKVLWHGGVTGDGSYGGTNIYDLSNNTWALKTSSDDLKLFESSSAYMGGDQVLLFGGVKTNGYRSDITWIYDESENTWTQDINSTSPSARSGAGMAPSSMDGTGYIVLFGGFTDSRNDETWTFGGGDYSLPVELTTFTAESRSNGVFLTWRTESETENLGFIIEKRLQVTGDRLQVADYTTDEALQGHGSTSEAHEYLYTDAAVVPGNNYFYRLADVDYSGKVTWHKEVEVKVEAESEKIVEGFHLGEIYPNPFNATFTVPLTLGKTAPVKLTLCDLNGKVVKVIENSFKPAGEYRIAVDCSDLGSGIYFLQLAILNNIEIRKLVLIK